MARLPASIRIPEGCNGPAGSANGGVAAGTMAQLVAGPATVRLQAPPPLGVDLAVRAAGAEVSATSPDGTVVMTVRPTDPPDLDIPVIDPSAVGAGAPYPDHPAATCVVCGQHHRRGLRLFPAPVPGHVGVVGTWWTPPDWAIEDGRLRDDLLWGVLDCPGALAVMHAEDQPVFAALGSITGELVAPVAAGEQVLVLGFALGAEGRRRPAGTAVLGPDGDLRAHSSQVCVAVPPAWARGEG